MAKPRKAMIVASIPIEKTKDIENIPTVKGIDLIELRVDYCDNPLSIDYTLVKNLPVVVTLRDVDEGGAKAHDDRVKLNLLAKLSELGIMYDVEMKFVNKYGIDYENKVVSIHVLDPNRIDKEFIKNEVKKFMGKAFIVKIAVKPFPSYKQFLVELLELGENIAVMPIGVDPTERIAFTLLGSKLLYCYIDKPTAPSQPRCSDVLEVLNAISNLRREPLIH